MNSQKPEFKPVSIKPQSTAPRFKYETRVVVTVGNGATIAEQVQKRLDSSADGGFRFVGMLQMSSEAVIIFEKDTLK